MQMPMCSRCGKNVAVIFITKMDPNNQDSAAQEGLCGKCYINIQWRTYCIMI